MTTWRAAVAPIVKKLRLTVMFGTTTKFNVDGSAALADMLEHMARLIDDEIEAREQHERQTE